MSLQGQIVSSPTRDTTTREILGRVVATLADAEAGWRDLCTETDAHRNMRGLKETINQGRSVTFVLQKLRSREPGFEIWYASIQMAMRSDPLMRYFHTLRTEIQKEGLPSPIMGEIEFIREGAVVATAEVAVGEDVYGIWIAGGLHDPSRVDEATASNQQLLRNIRLPNPPHEHLGLALTDDRIEYLARLYLDYLRERVVNLALNEFGKTGV
jgi:hypothetical protein